VFHFDCFWMKEYHWSDFSWDDRVFPVPEKMLDRLKAKGLKICLWINPYIAQRSRLFSEGKEYGYLLKKPDGAVWQWDLWQAGMAIVDFTNPEACRWFAAQLARLLDMGVDCFKTDFGERIPTDVVYSDGSDPVKMHNYYTYLYNKVVFELLREKRGPGEAAVFARSATAGSQCFPVHWGGDCWARYESMAESLRGGLSLGLSGFGFWSHDIGGFENTATADLYKRWVAFGLLSSHSRLHGSSSYRVPWLFDAEAVDVLRYFTKLKCSLMPYLFAIAQEAAGLGIPVMRAMMLEFPEDPACEYLDRQYMLGDALLIAPVFNEDGAVSYYLPSGNWTSWLTGEKVTGGCWRKEQHDYLSIPLLVRPNTLLASGRSDNRPDYDFTDGVTLHLFELEEGHSVSQTIFNLQGLAELEVTVQCNVNSLSVTAQGVGKPWSLLWHGKHQVQTIQGGTAVEDPRGLLISPAEFCGRMQMEFEQNI
ncbi:MAG TPA: alpha-xylosidase, partial [Bacillota bacterium]|nr:alpha-xylosidase [Bacillota bacterium]